MTETGGDGPAPELDDFDLRGLLTEAVDRTETGVAVAARLDSLLQAVVAIGSQLSVDDVLHNIVATGAKLVDAEYAALGVLGPFGDRRLAEFITVGVDAAQMERIGDLPTGRGVLGVLIDEPRAIRIADINAHPARHGFPANHPPMSTFLGVPITVGGQPFGNLYLTEKRGGIPFTAADEQIAMVLATAAGLAVQNARLHEQASQRQSWLEASSDITTKLLAGAPQTEVFPSIVEHARALAGGAAGFLALPAGNGDLLVEAAAGPNLHLLVGQRLPADSMSARVMAKGMSIAVPDARFDPRIWQAVVQVLRAGPAIFVPLGTSSHTVGTLVVTNKVGAAPFSGEATNLVSSFAGQAALALRLGAVAQDREQLAVLSDRDRIARDLHDLVIQRLFATGMALEGALRTIRPKGAAASVRRAVDDLDTTIKEIRTSIFALQSPAPSAGEGLRTAILHAAQTAALTLGFEPRVTFSGPVDTAVPQHVGEQLLAVMRETLSNSARHAKASMVDVELTVTPGEVRLRVRDDGRGIPSGGRRSGLTNLVGRAQDLGGTFHAVAAEHPATGTVAEWMVPLPA